MGKKTFFILLVILSNISQAQKQANVWHFGDYYGLNFNSGYPQKFTGFYYTARNCASISDSNGIFLFGTNGDNIWNKEGMIMHNGYDLEGNIDATSGVLIVQKPGSDHLYYVFTVARYQSSPGMYYSVLDMNLDNGLGDLTPEKNVPLSAAWDANEKLTSVRHKNGKDIWIITRKTEEDAYVGFLLTENGIDENPVLSYSRNKPDDALGSLKVSYDKKYFISANGSNGLGVSQFFERYEVSRFNAASGELEFMYSFPIRDYDNSYFQNPNSVEFSPDSKLAYLGTWANSTENPGDETEHRVYQYDMSLIEDSAQFIQSAILISHNGGAGLQLATDGKIYCGRYEGFVAAESPLNVIHYPWKRGTACFFEENAIDFGVDQESIRFLPNILLDHLYRFEFEGHCSGEPFQFQSNFQPEPAFIEWNFADPLSGSGNISNEINPVHTFSGGGEYEVHVHVEYPNGRIEETSRVVAVTSTPKPVLGADLFVCQGQEVVLNAGNSQGFYTWSNGNFGENANQVTVSDSGWYWVQVNNDGCIGSDTVYLGFFPKAVIIEDNLQLIPSACGTNNGKILGLAVSGEEPLSYQWFDADSNLLVSTLDVSDLGVGNYFLHILDGNGCTTISDAYTITDAGDIEIASVNWQNTHCDENMGSITITVATGDPLSMFYSINNGTDWQTGDPLFENLAAGNYFIRVKDENGCESVFDNNPVVVEDMPGPVVSSAVATPENDYLQNGQITISATVNEGEVYYSIDGGNNFQAGDGLFTNLSAGTYFCEVKDDFGCDTVFTVEVTRIISQLIEAFAGDGTTCIGNAAVVPLKLNNFSDISKFHLKLTYDTAMLSCDGFINVNTTLENNVQVSIIPQTDEVLVSWQGETATTLEENATLLELVFGAKKEGISALDWAAQAGESAFYNENMEEVNADYHLGMVRVYTRPKILMNKQEAYCTGDSVFTFVFVADGSGEIEYQWSGPGGYSSNGRFLELENVSQDQAGLYTLTVTDTIECVESKTVNLEVYPHPQIAFPEEDTIYTSPGFILEAGSGYENYLWNTGDTTDYLQIQSEGLYSVEVTSQASCKSSDSVTVLWGGEAFWVPNAFSPDGDGLNDEFKPVERYDMVRSYNLSIYNRWGQLIFQTNDISQGWDGSYQGNPAEQGSYVYKIVFTAYPDYNQSQTKTGSVVLVR